jgi:predicted nucleotidyltransferase
MASVVNKLYSQKLINPPSWLPTNTMFEGWTGSVAYGASDNYSDIDVVGFCIPHKNNIFPHLIGEIRGFGKQTQSFEQWQKHHIKATDSTKEYDITIYSIVKFLQLTMENNPNMVDNLFLPRRSVLHSTSIYEYIRDNRKLFLHKGSWYKFRGYALSQMTKLNSGSKRSNNKRQDTIDKFGYDVKFAYHCIRLLLECEQILSTQDLILDRDSKVYLSIRAGEWDIEQLNKWVDHKLVELEHVYTHSKLREAPDEQAIYNILINCLEEHFGSLSEVINNPSKNDNLYNDLQQLMENYR